MDSKCCYLFSLWHEQDKPFDNKEHEDTVPGPEWKDTWTLWGIFLSTGWPINKYVGTSSLLMILNVYL